MSPNHADQVRVKLTATSRASKALYLERHLVLTRDAPNFQIGRMSQRNPDLKASSTNAWFESAVMSRHHAMLNFDADRAILFVQDTGSLHGTFYNDTRLVPGIQCQLQQGDQLRFGITVDRHPDSFPPCAMSVTFEFDDFNNRPQANPVVYRVPDDTDVEDGSDDEDDDDDDLSICSSTHALRENGLCPAQPIAIRNIMAIDLTSDADTAENQMPDYDAENDAAKDDEPRVEEDEHAKVPEPLQQDQPDGCGGVWQPTSPATHSVDNDHQDADGNVQPCPAKRADRFPAADSDEWEDCSSSSRSRVASVRPSTLPASWETEGFSSSSDGIESDTGMAFCLNPVLSSLPCSSPVPRREDVDVEPSKTAAEQEASPVEESADYCNPTRIVLPPQDMARLNTSDGPPCVDAARRVLSASVRLPGFPLPSQGQSSQAAAESLGEKSGKTDYFAARLDNKRLLESLHGAARLTEQRGVGCSARAPEPAHYEDAPMEKVTEEDEGGPEKDDQVSVSLFALSGENPLTALDDPSTNSLLASGEKFLFSPPREPEAPLKPAEAPELSELSAYQFELSKLDARRGKNQFQHNSIPMQDKESRGLPDIKRACHKRKAAEISMSRARMDATNGVEAPAPTSRSTARKEASRDMGDSRAVKRLRTAAEVLGYAALGGVAVVSALIATAPAL
ncbi:hypothetical protein XA68_17333 [Ophiocordyceps unilateralis]|uniref:FHA domain-containing protein n=1 Tax=Ophiocordyceps unilateralis TaxID=268505 RepID=A0A2A9P4Z0_OPHUN|nr:hypothetical protein XA68_17333 [Ophiocordyceps unilateralis]